MSLSAERYKILQNIIARAGGIDKVDLYSELAKSQSLVNQFQAKTSFDAYNNMQNAQANSPVNPMETPEMTPSTTEGEIMPETGQNPL